MAKTGRKPTGLKRKNIVQVGLTHEENEFVARHCYDNGLSAALYGRQKMLVPGWRDRLELLRRSQKRRPLHELDARRRE